MLKIGDYQLRHVRATDLDALCDYLSDIELRGAHLPMRILSPEETRKAFQTHGLSTEDMERLVLVDRDQRVLGLVWHFVAVPYMTGVREIGYILYDERLRNTGVISATVRKLVDYLFESRPLNRLEIRMSVENLASEKVAIKCGFSREGVSRGANYVRGRYVDMAVYALLRHEWQHSTTGDVSGGAS